VAAAQRVRAAGLCGAADWAINQNTPEQIMGSWRTKLFGFATILVAVGNYAIALANGTQADIGITIAAISSGIANIMSRDNKVTSEQAGAK
jgi:hypothetical protein